MKTNLYLLLFSGYVFTFYACASVKPYYDSRSNSAPIQAEPTAAEDIDYFLYLVGGATLTEASPVMDAIHLDRRSANAGLILLGDIIELDNLPPDEPKESTTFLKAVKTLDNIYKDLYIVPGE